MSLQSRTISRNHEKAPSRHHQQHSTRPENGIFATFCGLNLLQIGKHTHICELGNTLSCHRHRKGKPPLPLWANRTVDLHKPLTQKP